jgi:3-deoxy-D-manno-octulosonate 8-phosphate phosphatase (KDO 8-P phosphatase)
MNFFKSNLIHLQQLTPEKGEVLKETGLASLISSIVSGDKNPTLDDMESISKGLGLSLDILFFKDLSKADTTILKDLKFLVLDVDGVMTDGGMYYTEKGDEFKRFDTRDGVAIRRLTRNGFKVGIISSGFLVNIIQSRADLLGIQYVHTGQAPKLETLTKWSKDLKISMEQIAFIGDDLNDKEVMEAVGVSACPADAVDGIREVASIILSNKGGRGCIREFVDNYLSHI